VRHVLHRGLAVGRRWVGDPRQAEVTLVLAGIIFAVMLVLSGTPDIVDRVLLRSVSTNISQLERHATYALVTSAFFVSSPADAWSFVPLALLGLAPLEQRIGSIRFLASFALGHVGASLIVYLGLKIGVATDAVEPSVRRVIDVGYSYGSYCCLAVLTFVFVGRARLAWGVGLLALLVLALVLEPSFTAWGHLTAGLLGFAAGPFACRRYHRQVGAGAPLAIPVRRPLP
jgi:Rhomboid-like protein